MTTPTSEESFKTVPERALRWDERLVAMAAHEWMPEAFALRLLAPVGSLRWLAAPQRQTVTRWSQWLLGPGAPDSEVRSLARRALRQRTVERLWINRTELAEGIPPEGLSRLLETLRQGRGVLVASAHLVDVRDLMLIMAAHGAPSLAVSGVPPSVRLRRVQPMDRFKRRTNLRSEELGGSFIGAAGSYGRLAAHLSAGGCVLLAADVGGSVPALIAGKQVRVSSGAVSLAQEADAPIVPAFLVAHNRSVRAIFETPLDPRELVAADLQARLIAVLDTYVSANLLSWSTPKSLRRTCDS